MLSDYDRIVLGLLCGGCKVIATKNTSKTAYQGVKVNTKNCPRHCHVWSLLEIGTNSRRGSSSISSTDFSRKSNLNLYNCILLAMGIVLALGPAAYAAPTTAVASPLRSTAHPRSPVLLRRTILASGGSHGQPNATTSATPTNATAGTASAIRQRKRHSKRHSNWYDYDKFNENSTLLEWANPCGGMHVPSAQAKGGRRTRRKNPKQVFNLLKKSATTEFRTLNRNDQDIDISNIQSWSLHNYTYKFLPKLKMNSTVALKRWYRNMQTYVGSFAYLRRTQLRWDHTISQRDSATADELKHLMLSSRRMLCELEAAVNATQPAATRSWPLPSPSRHAMNKRLTLRTKRGAKRTPGLLQEADPIDLKFVKYYYYEYLETMWQLLRKNTKRKGQAPLAAQATAPAHRKEFNEVDKPRGASMRGYSRRRGPQSGGGGRRVGHLKSLRTGRGRRSEADAV